VSDKALEATINLCVDICKRNGIEKINYTGDKTGNLTMHKWFAATGCPGPYLSEKFPYIANEINKRLGVDVPVEKRELHLGDKGEDVIQLQKDLIELGYNLDPWGADGDFGKDTDKAVRAFQKKSNLDVDGWVGKNTYAAIEKALAEKRKPAPAPAPALVELQLGSQGTEVIELQKKLLKLGYDLSPWGADGDFGQKTDVAVRAFQKDNNLDVDGIVGPNTLAALDKALAQPQNVPYLAKINAKILNVRKGPGATYPVVLTVGRNEVYTIVAEQDGWGKLKSGAGWIDLKYTVKV
jgi:peptidoglycan hydrolase-like protein with peptidoglycan-binding domain